MRTTPMLASATVLLVAAALHGCGPAEPTPPRQPPAVVAATAGTGPVTVYLYYNGTVREIEKVEVRARVAGYLEQVVMAPSSNVEPGDLLFVIEQEPYRIAVQQAEAAVAAAQAELDLAQVTLARTRDAFAGAAASQTELDTDEAVRAQRQAQLRVAEAQLEQATLDLRYTEVRSPIRGRVAEALVDQGNLVGVDGPTLLTTVVQMDPIHAYFFASEQVALKYLARGEDGSNERAFPEAFLQLANERGFPHAGRVDYCDNVLDASTGTLEVRALFDNDSRRLYPGLFARIRVPFETIPDAVLVHEEAIGTDLAGKHVVILDDENVAARRPVELGERLDDGRVQIVQGLAAGERYVRSGLQFVRPGLPVRIRDDGAAGDDRPAAASQPAAGG